MKRLQVLIFISGCLTFFPVDNAKARAWRGIIPLHSTRSDVRRLLGKPIVGGDGAIDLYELREGHVNIRYARRECEQGLPADWGNWKVPRDTVVNISIGLHQELSPAELKTRTLKPFKWYTDTSGATYYRDKRRGIEYQVQEGMVTAITYGPTARDGRLLCRKNMPLIRY